MTKTKIGYGRCEHVRETARQVYMAHVKESKQLPIELKGHKEGMIILLDRDCICQPTDKKLLKMAQVEGKKNFKGSKKVKMVFFRMTNKPDPSIR